MFLMEGSLLPVLFDLMVLLLGRLGGAGTNFFSSLDELDG